MSKKIKVGIVGATGYTGVELLRLLAAHPDVEVAAVTSRSEAGTAVADYFPSLRGVYGLAFQTPDEAGLEQCDIVFFATPNGIAMKDALRLLEQGVRVIDLSADFRIRDIPTWEHWYGMTHAAPGLVSQAVYGLSELNREAVAQARLVANPGCYPTCVSLPLVPLLRQCRLKPGMPLIADCKSGVSGAGRKGNVGSLLCEAGDNFKAYGIAGHRHLPEIRQTIAGLQDGIAEGFVFTPHLAPMIRGMHATVYLHLSNGICPKPSCATITATACSWTSCPPVRHQKPAACAAQTSAASASNRRRNPMCGSSFPSSTTSSKARRVRRCKI